MFDARRFAEEQPCLFCGNRGWACDGVDARFQAFFEKKYLESNIACYNEANHNHISVEDIAEEVERPERRRNYCYYSMAAFFGFVGAGNRYVAKRCVVLSVNFAHPSENEQRLGYRIDDDVNPNVSPRMRQEIRYLKYKFQQYDIENYDLLVEDAAEQGDVVFGDNLKNQIDYGQELFLNNETGSFETFPVNEELFEHIPLL
eukprot:TRINITY_DN6219_c0_g1_i2.p1 TRINITY_DN6219_c0_g1~~TRINITY_DN6219_c0_g1_i2.p1  ORF type:complete len:202 (-),score=34.61 TRINITY_DN6219_c0_g1_i2:62-667(-)